jgi:ribosome modulation factor
MRLEIDGNAWNRGFWDGEQGTPLRFCPYDIGTTERWSWSSGYIEGNAVRNGYAVIRPAPKQQEKPAPGDEADAVPLRSTASASSPEETQEKGVNIARRSGVKVRRRLTTRQRPRARLPRLHRSR